MRLARVVSSPPSQVRCRQLNRTLLVKLKSYPMPTLGLRPVLQANRLWWKLEFRPPHVPPKAWLYVSRASLEIVHWIVMLTVGSFWAVGLAPSPPPALGSYMWR